MRIFEIFLFIFAFFNLITLKKRKLNMSVLILAMITLVLHIFIEQIRWSLYPLYILILILFIMKEFKVKRKVYKRFNLFFMFTIFISLFLSIILPVDKMIEPTGDYKIGTVSYEVTDYYHKEIYTNNTDDYRKIKFKVWYPTDDIKGLKQEKWLEDGELAAKGISKMLHFPDFVMSHLALVKSNSYDNAEVSLKEDKYPVVVISHGWTGFREIHTDVAENLASHGYIVVSIDHTYGSAVTVFEDEVVYLNREALPDRDTMGFLTYAEILVKTYSNDIIFTIDEIEKLNAEDDKFMGKMDLTNIGVIGHSTGGGASVRSSLKDDRIKALVGLDAWVEPLDLEEINEGLTIPSLFFRSKEWENGYNNPYLINLLKNSNDPLLLQIDGSKHVDFTMAYMFSPMSKYIGLTGKLDGKESSSMQQDIILDFINQNLKQDETIDLTHINEKYSKINIINYQ